MESGSAGSRTPPDAICIERDQTLLSDGSGEKSATCAQKAEGVTSIENGQTPLSCSNVANPTILNEMRAIAEEALEALEAGRIDIAKARLMTFVAAAQVVRKG